MQIDSALIEETFAEAFGMTACRTIVTADSSEWVSIACTAAVGCASSVIGCDCEAAIERTWTPEETPDGRPGASVLFFAFNSEGLQKAVIKRVGQAVMTSPTTACFNGLDSSLKSIDIGGKLRFFGDGFQISKFLDGRRYWRIPTMDGEFLCEGLFGTVKAVGGGNFLVFGPDPAKTLTAATVAAHACRTVPGVILPFPGGVVRSGSKVGSKYAALKASTSETYCPTLRALVPTKLKPDEACVYEIVIDGLDEAAVGTAMRVGIRAACEAGATRISAGNYGGKLGPFHFHLHQLLES